jgi:hypothetical protein
MDVKLTCPLGSTCEEIKDNQLHRCRWYTELKGTDAQGKEHNTWDCAITWMPILQLEASTTNRSIAGAIESARNVNDINQKAAVAEVRKLNAS